LKPLFEPLCEHPDIARSLTTLAEASGPGGVMPSLPSTYFDTLTRRGEATRLEIKLEIEQVSEQLVGALRIGGVTHLGNDATLSPSNAVVLCEVEHLIPLIETLKAKGLFSIQTKAMVALAEQVVLMRTYAMQGDLEQLDALMLGMEDIMKNG